MEYADIAARLGSLGYVADDEKDTYDIMFVVDKVERLICAACNTSGVPPDMRRAAIDAVCGAFLTALRARGELDGFDVAGAVQSLREGDTQVTYAMLAGDKTTFDGLARSLSDGWREMVPRYRRLEW